MKPHQKSVHKINEIRLRANRSGFEHGLVKGLNGRLLVKDATGTLWSYSPISGKSEHYTRTRVANYGRTVSERRAFLRSTSNFLREKILRRHSKFPKLKNVEITLDITREQFGKIYAGLMNEINVRKDSDSRSPVFDSRLQRTRGEQEKKILETKEALQKIHSRPENTEMGYAGMTNDLDAVVFLREVKGKPSITIQRRYPSEPPSREVSYVMTVLETLLKEQGIKYTKEIKKD